MHLASMELLQKYTFQFVSKLCTEANSTCGLCVCLSVLLLVKNGQWKKAVSQKWSLEKIVSQEWSPEKNVSKKWSLEKDLYL